MYIVTFTRQITVVTEVARAQLRDSERSVETATVGCVTARIFEVVTNPYLTMNARQ